jgi:cell division protein FtsB
MIQTVQATPARADVEMPKLQPRRRERTWIHGLLLFAALVLFVNSVFGEQGLADSMRARRQIHASATSLSTLRAENGRLRDQIRRLKEDPWAIEEVARRDLGLIRKGEILVVVKDKDRKQ